MCVELGVGEHFVQDCFGTRRIILFVVVDKLRQGFGVARLDSQDTLAVLQRHVGASQGTDVNSAQAPRNG